jgi:hypothetical protein
MNVGVLLGGLILLAGFVASIVQILQYVEQRREKRHQPAAGSVTTPSPPVSLVPKTCRPVVASWDGRKTRRGCVRHWRRAGL